MATTQDPTTSASPRCKGVSDSAGDASAPPSSRPVRSTKFENPTTHDPFGLEDAALYRRLIPVLAEAAQDAGRVEAPSRFGGVAWDRSVLALVDLPDYDDFNPGCLWDHEVADGDVEAAVQSAIGNFIDRMTGFDDLLEHDVALALGGRIVAVLRTSPTGPVLTRLDGDRPQAGGERDDVPHTTADGGDEGDVRRSAWVSTAETRATVERAFKGRQPCRGYWIHDVVALIDSPDGHHVRELPIGHGRYLDWEDGLEVAIVAACEAMLPISGDRPPLDPEHPEPLRCDVALAVAGRIHAVVQRTEAGPVVYRFRDLWPSMV